MNNWICPGLQCLEVLGTLQSYLEAQVWPPAFQAVQCYVTWSIWQLVAWTCSVPGPPSAV